MNDKTLGYIIFLGSLFGIGLYFYLIFVSPWAMLVLQISAFLAVAVMLAIGAWIGYTLTTSPLPLPLEDFVEEPSNEDDDQL